MPIKSVPPVVRNSKPFNPTWANPATFANPPAINPSELKLCFAFLCDSKQTGLVGDPHPIWQRFFEACNRDGYQYEIAIHSAKTLSEAYEPFRLLTHAPTTWERNIQAHKPLIAFANTKGCDKTILLSETCIPTANPFNVWSTLAKTVGKTVLNGVHPLSPEENKKWHRYPALNNGNSFWKAEQWAFVDKEHYHLYKETEISNQFVNSVADNEAYLISLLREHDQSHNVIAIKQNGAVEALHLSVWHKGEAHPLTYLTAAQIENLKTKKLFRYQSHQVFSQQSFEAKIKRGVLFMRKFDHSVLPEIRF